MTEDDEHREHTSQPFNIAVVGDARVMTPTEAAVTLDYMVHRYVGLRAINLVSAGGSPGERWAGERRYDVLPVLGSTPVKAICDMIAQADAVVVFGDPTQYRLLLWLAEQAQIPFTVFRRPPLFATLFKPATNMPD